MPLVPNVCKCISPSHWPGESGDGKEGVNYLNTGVASYLGKQHSYGSPANFIICLQSFYKNRFYFFIMPDHCQTHLSFPGESVIKTEFPFSGNAAWSVADSGQGLVT